MQRPKLEKIYLYIIKGGIYLTLFTPLVVARDYFFPFVSPKTIFFRIIVDIIFITYILLVLSNSRYRPKLNPLTISITVFLGVLILTSITGINFERSFWSTFERMTGLLTFFHLYIFFIILTSVFKERREWERILTVSILVGILLCFYVYFANDAFSRGGATIGNVSFLAAYLFFDIFFAMILFFAKRGVRRIFYGIVLILMLFTMFSASELPRGAIGAFLLAMILLVFGYMIFSGRRLLKKLAPVTLILMVLLSIGISQTKLFKRAMLDVKEIPGEAREIVWQIGFDSWQERFWLGWGPENFNVAFAKNFNPRLPMSGDIWYDRAHNVVFDTAVDSGIIGLISYLSIFGIAVVGLLKLCSKIAEKRNIILPLGMTALLIFYFFQNIWVFDMISSYMIFFLSLAFISFLISPSEEYVQLPPLKKKSPLQLSLGSLLIIIALFALYFGNIQPARASYDVIRGLTLGSAEAIAVFEKAIQASPMSIFEVPEQFSRRMIDFSYDASQKQDVLEKGFELAAGEMKKAIRKGPQDFRLHLFLGKHYNDYFRVSRDGENLKLADIYLEKALELSPVNQQVYWALAQTRLYQGRGWESVALIQESIDLSPQFPYSWWVLAMTYRIIGQNELAAGAVKEAEEVGYDWKANPGDLKKVIEIYQNLRDDGKLVELYLLAIERDSSNAQFWFGLVTAYANLDQFDKAAESARRAIEINPDLSPQLEKFLIDDY